MHKKFLPKLYKTTEVLKRKTKSTNAWIKWTNIIMFCRDIKVEFDYQAGPAAYAMVVGDGTTYMTPTEYLEATSTTKHVEMTVVGSGQTWIGLYENGGRAGSGSMGQTSCLTI